MVTEMVKVWFNDVEITKYMVVTELLRNIGTTRTNELKKSGVTDGKIFSSRTLEEKNITMKFALIDDVITKRRALGGVLNAVEPGILWFSDEPDVYYEAIPTGDIDVDDKRFYGFGTIVWQVPDGVAHSKEPDVFSSVKEPDFTSQPAKYTAGQTWLVEAGHTVEVTSDYKGKSSGSDVENPNNFRYAINSTLLAPTSASWMNHGQLGYDQIMELDNIANSSAVNQNQVMAQKLFSYNVLEIAKRTFNGVFEELSEAEQVAKLNTVVVSAQPSVWGRGLGPSGNKLTLNAWGWSAWQGGNSYANSTNTISEIKYQKLTSVSNYLTNGIFSLIASSEPADGTTASTVYVDYVNLVITFNNPHVGKLLRATKSSDTFNMADWELVPPDPNNTAEIDVEYKGTYESYPILKATMTSENGLVAFINSKGKVIQIGDPESVDGYDYQISDKVIHEGMERQGNWEINEGKILYANYMDNPETPNVIDGAIDWTSNYDTAIPVYPTNFGNVWGGPTLHLPIPKNSNNANTGNFEFKSRFHLKGSTREVGRFQFHLQNGDAIPFAVFVRDSSTTKSELEIEIWINEIKIWNEVLSSKEFNGDFFEIVMERYGTQFTTKLHQISKVVSDVVEPAKTFQKTLDLENVKDVPVTHLTMWSAIWGYYSHPRMEYTDVKFTWVNVEKWQNIPNLFNEGDELVLDTSSGEIFVNGILRDDLDVLGSDWEDFFIKDNGKIYCIPSSWAAEPLAEVISRGAWL